MFPSKTRPIVFPQAEHLKLAGALALLWGNERFARPPVPFDSFVLGVALHDRAYGPLDNLPIGGIPVAEWMALTEQGFATAWADPVAEAIVKHHLQRLMSYGQAPERVAAAQALAAARDAWLAQHQLDPQTFARIDCITKLCDDIAFDFCFETPAEGAVEVYPRWEADAGPVTVRYRCAGGVISLDPWPFVLPRYTGYILGYAAASYPDQLTPLVVGYAVEPLQQLTA